MSTAKRAKRRQPEAKTASPLPASKRLKTTPTAHVPAASSGLGFLVDEDARHGRKLEAKLTNGVPAAKTTKLDESRAAIAPDSRDDPDNVGGTQDTAIDISSAEESSSDDEEDADADVHHQQNGVAVEAGSRQPLLNGHAHGRRGYESEEDAVAGAEDVEMEEAGEEADAEEPSFGDMLRARHPQAIDVQASFPNPMADRQALVPTSSDKALSAPSGISLGTVLTQALKTNDKDLLESCFQTTDHSSIRATIQRLQSQHVGTLLQRLAERIHKRPGRTGNLMVWVQWSLVAHGGYLATQPELVKKLRSLSQVIRDRANGLQPLLHLKGKLDMLSAQLELRRNMQAASRAANADDDDNEEGVVYVEGRGDDWSDSDDADALDEDVDMKLLEPPSRRAGTGKAMTNEDESASEGESDDDSDEEMPNGVAHEGSSEEEDDEPGMFDIEAEETDDDEGDEEEEDSGDEEESDASSDSEADASDVESEDSGVKQPKPTILNRKR